MARNRSRAGVRLRGGSRNRLSRSALSRSCRICHSLFDISYLSLDEDEDALGDQIANDECQITNN